MTLDEAIEHFSQLTKNTSTYLAFERQILRWLEELKQDREIIDNIVGYSKKLQEIDKTIGSINH